ncbi:hypothetical protein, partial [Brunnivagina elsteri]
GDKEQVISQILYENLTPKKVQSQQPRLYPIKICRYIKHSIVGETRFLEPCLDVAIAKPKVKIKCWDYCHKRRNLAVSISR